MSESPLLQAVRGMQVSDPTAAEWVIIPTAAEQSESGEASASRRHIDPQMRVVGASTAMHRAQCLAETRLQTCSF